MPVPCKRDFGLAIDAATGAKRMQNGAAVEANLQTTQRQYVTGGLMIAIIFANPAAGDADRTSRRSQMAASARSLPPGLPVAEATSWCTGRGRQPTRCNRSAMLRLARSTKGTQDVRAHRLPQFPVGGPPRKRELNSAAFRQATPPHGNFMRHRERFHIEPEKPRRNPLADLDGVMMLVKICVD